MTTSETSLRQCIENLSLKNTDYKYPEQAINQAESLKSLSSDLYTDNIRFIYELIQNADDAQAKNVIVVVLKDEYLIIAHDGKTFDEKDLEGLCGINNGTKKKDLDKSGYKGLGFKAVFGKSEKVFIYSNEEYFRFDSSYPIEWNKQWETNDQQIWEKQNDRLFIYPWQINPVWTNQNEVPGDIRDFLNTRQNQIHVANIILLNNVEEIRLAIDQLKEQPYMFLFLRNTSHITLSNKTVDIVSIDRNSINGLKKVYLNAKTISQWIIKRCELDVPDAIRDKLVEDAKVPEKLRFIKKAEIFLAAKYKDPMIDPDGIVTSGGGIEKLRDQESILFSYLPTKILEYKFPVLINANFSTNANREQIHTDSVWNQWLFDRIGDEIFQWIKELVTNENFRFQAYRIIPSRLNLTNNVLSERFNKSFDWSVKQCNFILNRKNQLLRVDEVIMDLTSMSEQTSFINIDSMRQYIIFNDKHHFECAQCPFIDYDQNLSRVGVKQFNWLNCIEMFKSDLFLKTHSVKQNKQMIEYFHSNYSKVELPIEISINIQQIPFLMNQNNRLQLIKDIYFPAETIGDSETSDSNDSFVNKIIFNWLNESPRKEIKQWLQKLGVTERTDLTYLHKTIIPNAATYITSDNAIKTIEMLFLLFQKNAIGKNEFDQLKKLSLLTTCRTLIPAEECLFSDQYRPRLSLEEYLKTKEDKFLSFDYLKAYIFRRENEDLCEWRRFFNMLGVQEELHPIEFEQKLSNSEAMQHGFHRDYLLRSSPDGFHIVYAYSGLKTITFLDYTKDNVEFAKFFWAFVIKNIKVEKIIQNTRLYWGHLCKPGATNGTATSNAEYVGWFVKNTECVPTTLNTCELSSNIFVESKEMKELCGQYMPFPSIPLSQDKTSWHYIFNFKTKLSVNDYFVLLEKIRHDEKSLKDNLDRIQMIYSYILKDIQSYTTFDKISIQFKANPFYLLSEDNHWKLAKDLHLYVENNGTNSHLNDAIPCLKIDIKNKNHPHIGKFIELFNIIPIKMDDLKLVHKNSHHAEQFREKLIEISPCLKKWLKTLTFRSDDISLIDKILQQETHFIESDCLKLFLYGKLFQETNVYSDTIKKQFYITRPWNSETALMDLPTKLCQLLNIQGFEDKLRFLLKAQNDEIMKHLKKLSIEIPTDKDKIKLERIPRPEIVQEVKSLIAIPPLSKESASFVQGRETKTDKNAGDLEDTKESISTSEHRKSTVGPSVGMNSRCDDVSYRDHHDLIQSTITEINPPLKAMRRSSLLNTIKPNDNNFESIQLIDMSAFNFDTRKDQFNVFEEINDLNLHTGYIGEQKIYKYLQEKYSSQLNSVVIKWENENGESNLPYDILLIKNGIKHYIEVKSTRTYNQHSFQLSINQIKAILQYKENYFIYRLYSEENKLIILDNIEYRLSEQQLACFLTIKRRSLNKTIDKIQ